MGLSAAGGLYLAPDTTAFRGFDAIPAFSTPEDEGRAIRFDNVSLKKRKLLGETVWTPSCICMCCLACDHSCITVSSA